MANRIAACMIGIALGAPIVHAERLAARRFTTADGLAGDFIIHLARDSRGFLWFSTRDGLSRFDGVQFTSYGMSDGLPAATVNHLLETSAGEYWVSTNGGGMCQFNPNAGRSGSGHGDTGRATPLFVSHSVGSEPVTNRVNVAFEDRAGHIWAGTDDGLFRLVTDSSGRRSFTRVDLPQMPADVALRAIFSLNEGPDGSLWIGGGWGLTRRLPDGRDVIYRITPSGGTRDIVDVIRFDGTRMWAGLRSGLLRMDPAPAAGFAGLPTPLVRQIERRPPATALSTASVSPQEPHVFLTSADGLPADAVGALFVASGGRVMAGTARGLAEIDGTRIRRIGAWNGIPDSHISGILEDSAGSLWISSVTGATRVVRNGLVTFDEADGLANSRIHSLSEDGDGQLLVIGVDYRISRLVGNRFITTRPSIPAEAVCTWMSPCGYLDRRGGWWITSPLGLYRWAIASRVTDLATRPAQVVYSSRNGLPDDHVLNAYEDRSGNVWIATAPGGVLEWRRDSGMWREYGEADGLPPLRRSVNTVSAFAEDRAGNLWVGFEQGVGVARRRGDRFQRFTRAEGAPMGTITAMLVDSSGRLWIGSNQDGLTRVDDPNGDRVVFHTLTTAGGLGSNNIRCLTDDDRGRIYAGTSRGVDRLDPVSGAIKHYSVGEGLASDFVTAARRDRRGALWFGTMAGLSRLDPAADATAPATTPPPPVLISSLRVAGAALPVSELGDAAPPAFVLSPDRNQLEIGYFGFSFESGEPLRYQYRLEGTDQEWSPPTPLRSVNYGRLSGGSYRFVVRAVRPDGVVSPIPAVVTFTVLPPIYARWWFIAIAAACLAALGLLLYRARVNQLLRVERVRARIATDLHDDIGASLSQIAILAEVARERLHQEHASPEAAMPLARIAETSRGLVDSMSDIVWAINPQADTLADLVRRMRRFVEDTLGVADLDVIFRAPEHLPALKLGADVRREVFLVLKESVTNIAKHADASRVEIDLEVDRRRLRLRIGDNGKGFDPSAGTDGNGVASMRRRVGALGGHLTIHSAPGQGTTISFEVEGRT